MILLLAGAVYIGLVVLWLVAEQRWSRRIRITLGIVVLVFSLPLPVALTWITTQIDDNVYYGSSIGIVLDETIEALESGEKGFPDRLKDFRRSLHITYESPGNLLEKARVFRDEGKRIRSEGSPAGADPKAVHKQ